MPLCYCLVGFVGIYVLFELFGSFSRMTAADLPAGDIAEYALSWFQFAQEHGLLKGYEDNTVRPLNILTRAEGTVLIMRMIRALDSQENTAAGSEQ